MGTLTNGVLCRIFASKIYGINTGLYQDCSEPAKAGSTILKEKLARAKCYSVDL